MSFWSSFFGKKSSDKECSIKKEPNIINEKSTKTPSLHFKGKPDTNGLYPAELIMLSLAEKYKTTETSFPYFITNIYEIANPLKVLRDLYDREFLEIGTVKDYLPLLKLNELKDVAGKANIRVRGNKPDIIEQLSSISDVELSGLVKERNWKLSAKGKSALNTNPYIQFFMDKHSYNIEEVGVNIWTVNNEFVNNPQRPYRDIIYGQINKAMNEACIEFQKEPVAGTNAISRYCNCYRLMGLFLEEEKAYRNACDMYFQYLFKRINFYAGMQLLSNYKMFSYDKTLRENLIKRYYEEIQLYPFHKTELLRLLDECGITGNNVRIELVISFERTHDSGIMTAKEAADFIILELSGDEDQSRELAYKLAKKAVRKI